ncbi:MAG: phosphoethanolamine--lipid A transferase EptA [Steroidobacteraceae bacterium]
MRRQVEHRVPGVAPRRSTWEPSTITFIALAAVLNTALYHAPLLSFATRNLDLSTFTGLLTLVTLPLVVFLETAILFPLLALVSHRILKPLCVLFALGNAVAFYFLDTYQAMLDVTMMGNVLNTNVAEASEFLHPRLVGYFLALGVMPAWMLTRVHIRPSPRLRLVVMAFAGFAVMLAWAWLSASTWLWIDKNSKRLGGMVLPWSYVVNAARYQVPKIWTADTEVLLPAATFASLEKTVVILVIGEAARAQNFALYGYDRPTNPLLSQAGVVSLRNATACATYTTAAVRCILSNVDAESAFSRRYEPLPTYLQRHGVDVIWRSRNFGEPRIKVQSYQKADELAASCDGDRCNYDEVLLSGLEQRIRDSASQRVFVVLHQTGSHGPAYYTRYPAEFEQFKPVCKSVELSKCSSQALLNAYDNTILYQDHFLNETIGLLKTLQHTSVLLIYLSDHGESLGEFGLYLHGVPYSVAPDVQKDVPFILWMSEEFIRQKAVDARRLESQSLHSQRDVFHSVMGAFSMRSDAYEAGFDIFNEAFASQ